MDWSAKCAQPGNMHLTCERIIFDSEICLQGRIPGKTGVWIKDRKIGAVGVAISGGVTRHGVAFNVCPDLSAYSKIIACGDPVAEATSLKHELTNVDLDPGDVAIQLSQNFLKRIQFHGEEVALPDVNKLVNILGQKAHIIN